MVPFDDSVADGETQTGSPFVSLGGEEGIEDPVEVLFRIPTPVSAN
jgi:hypothetical protein